MGIQEKNNCYKNKIDTEITKKEDSFCDFYYFFIEVELIYNSVLVSGIQHSDSIFLKNLKSS